MWYSTCGCSAAGRGAGVRERGVGLGWGGGGSEYLKTAQIFNQHALIKI